jgi:hypothetical protein
MCDLCCLPSEEHIVEDARQNEGQQGTAAGTNQSHQRREVGNYNNYQATQNHQTNP